MIGRETVSSSSVDKPSETEANATKRPSWLTAAGVGALTLPTGSANGASSDGCPVRMNSEPASRVAA